MNDLELHHLLSAQGIDAPDPLADVERRADADPADPILRSLLRELHARATAHTGLPPHLGAVRRAELVRWDADSSTWSCTHRQTGAPYLARVLRPSAARDPLIRRALRRDRAALLPVLPGLLWREEPFPHLLLALPGPRATPPTTRPHPTRVVKTLARMQAWHEAGLGLPSLHPLELRDAGDHVAITLLTPTAPGDASAAIAQLVAPLNPHADPIDGELDHLLGTLSAHPPSDPRELVAPAVAALATHLADVRHRLVARARTTAHDDIVGRLLELIERLTIAVPPPEGRSVLGVGLDGEPMIVEVEDEVVLFGAPDALAPIVDPEGIDVPSARRLVRVRGSAPISDRLNAAHDGDPAHAERIARWMSVALELRALRMLTEAHSRR